MSDGIRTAEETKREHIARMGNELGTVYDALWQEVAWVYAKWADYAVLFGTSESRVALLNKAAPAFFRHVQDSLWEGILLHITRLTDPPVSAGKRNLTVRRLPTLIHDPSAKSSIENLIGHAMAKSEFARDWRNRHIAHIDLDLSISESAKALEFASRLLVKEALTALEAVLNGVEKQYLDSETSFEIGNWDAEHLLYVIDDGLHAEDKRSTRLLAGHYDPEDVTPRTL